MSFHLCSVWPHLLHISPQRDLVRNGIHLTGSNVSLAGISKCTASTSCLECSGMCQFNRQVLLVSHQHRDIILSISRRTASCKSCWRASRLLRYATTAATTTMVRIYQWLVNNLTPTRIVQNLLSVDFLIPFVVGSNKILFPDVQTSKRLFKHF